MRSPIPVGLRLGTVAIAFFSFVAACTGDDEIYAVPRDAGPLPDGTAASSGGSSSSSSSSGGTSNPDAATPDGGGNGEGGVTDGGDGGLGDSGSDGGGVVDSGGDSGPVVCSVVACAGNATCTALGCGSCNMGLGFCKP